jgi:hypothetical protein
MKKILLSKEDIEELKELIRFKALLFSSVKKELSEHGLFFEDGLLYAMISDTLNLFLELKDRKRTVKFGVKT